jgi:hypothetical protein
MQHEELLLPPVLPLALVQPVDRLRVDAVQQARDERVGLRVAQVERGPAAARGLPVGASVVAVAPAAAASSLFLSNKGNDQV